MCETGLFRLQRMQAFGCAVQLFEFFDLEMQIIESARPVGTGLLQGTVFFLCVTPLLVQARECADIGLQAGIFVQQLPLRGGMHQRLVRVLPVDVDQLLAEFAQCCQRYRCAIDIGSAAAVTDQDSAQQAFAVAAQVVLCEPLDGRRRTRQFEADADLGTCRPGPDHAVVGLVAEGQAQRIDQNRLAGTGLAGERGHAAFQREVEAADDNQVADVDSAQHAEIACLLTPTLSSSVARPSRVSCAKRHSDRARPGAAVSPACRAGAPSVCRR